MAARPSRSDEVRERMRQLAAEIERHMFLYYVLDAPEITDAEYDALVRELEALEREHPELALPDSPTRRVGAPPAEGFPTAPHRSPMLSLDNAMSEDEVRAFDERVRRMLGLEERPLDYVSEPKLDGAGVELVYEQGRLVQGLTRGDGHTGEDVSANLRQLLSIPLTLHTAAAPDLASVRGEVVLPLEHFRRLNRRREAEGLEPLANPRNAAAGALRQLHQIDLRRLRSLEFRAYAIAVGLPRRVRTQWQVLETLRDWGFVVSAESTRCHGIDEAIVAHARLLERRETLAVEVDGSVIKVDRLDLQDRLGTVSRSPRWAIAFKFPPQQARTRVREIKVTVGRTGALTPVAEVEPVQVGGVTVSNVSLHNQDFVEKKDVRVGDVVVIQRAGDVIPQLVRVVREERRGNPPPFRMPEQCPVCGAATVRLEGEVVTRCPNLDCPAQLKNNVLHLASRAALDIDGLGEKIVDQLVDKGLVRRLSDLFTLDAKTLAGLERMGEKSAAKLAASIDRARETTLARFLVALGIRHVGETVAEQLAAHFGDLDALMAARREEIEAIEGVGPVIAESVVRFFADPRNAAEVARLRELGVHWPRTEPHSARAEGPLSGRSFVITGTLSIPREEAKRRIEALGGRVTSTVSKKTDYVIVGEDPGSKRRKAEALGVPLLDEAAFEALLADPPPPPQTAPDPAAPGTARAATRKKQGRKRSGKTKSRKTKSKKSRKKKATGTSAGKATRKATAARAKAPKPAGRRPAAGARKKRARKPASD